MVPQTCFLANEFIDNDNPLFITNCDQIYDWNPSSFLNFCSNNDYDGVVITEKNTPTYSYIKLDDNNLGIELAEKIISEDALIGCIIGKRNQILLCLLKI